MNKNQPDWFRQNGFQSGEAGFLSGGQPERDEREMKRQQQALEILKVSREPQLRMQDVPGSEAMAFQLAQQPEDREMRALFERVVQDQIGRAMESGDPFWEHYPSPGQLPVLAAGRIPLVSMPLGDVLSLNARGLCKNVLVVGATGGGKTNWLRLLIASVVAADAGGPGSQGNR